MTDIRHLMEMVATQTRRFRERAFVRGPGLTPAIPAELGLNGAKADVWQHIVQQHRPKRTNMDLHPRFRASAKPTR